MRLHSPYLWADEIARVHEAALRILGEADRALGNE